MREIPFSTILNALADPARAFPKRYLEHFSDLSQQDLAALMQLWPQIASTRKRSLLKGLVEQFQEDTLLSFDDLAMQLLSDPDEELRLSALLLLEETRAPRLLPRLHDLLTNDPQPAVRAAAAHLLGNFIQLAELEELPNEKIAPTLAALLAAVTDTDGHLARTALEALGYATHPAVPGLITTAFAHPDPQWQAAALNAAKNSSDARWQEQVLAALNSPDQPVRLAAAEAAGTLELKPARLLLISLLEEEDDDEVLQAIIWSLSQIGGEDVRTYLQTLLDEAEDDEMIEFLEDALLNLSFTEDNEAFDLLALDPEDPE